MKSLRVGVVVALFAGPRLLAADAPPPPGSLRITLLGTGNPRPTSARSGPATLVLIDAGRGETTDVGEAGAREG